MSHFHARGINVHEAMSMIADMMLGLDRVVGDFATGQMPRNINNQPTQPSQSKEQEHFDRIMKLHQDRLISKSEALKAIGALLDRLDSDTNIRIKLDSLFTK